MKYKIPVEWAMYGIIDVEADSLQEAIDYAMYNLDEFSLPDEQEYMDGSFMLNEDAYDMAKHINNLD